jgi:hypothetical protein
LPARNASYFEVNRFGIPVRSYSAMASARLATAVSASSSAAAP